MIPSLFSLFLAVIHDSRFRFHPRDSKTLTLLGRGCLFEAGSFIKSIWPSGMAFLRGGRLAEVRRLLIYLLAFISGGAFPVPCP